MKLITLNIWGGKVYEPLLDFFKKYAEDVDIFCLQEVFHTPTDKKESRGIRANIFLEILQILKGYESYFIPVVEGRDFEGPVEFPLSHGIAMFIRKSIPITSSGSFLAYSGRDTRYGHPRAVQYVRLQLSEKGMTLCNFHGLVLDPPDNKSDNSERLEQSQRIKEFLDDERGEIIFGGDFNLAPDTKSMNIIDKNMRNLIKEYGIVSTRSSLHTKDMKFADYILVSPDVKVKDFRVIPDVVSDHLPLYLEFE